MKGRNKKICAACLVALTALCARGQQPYQASSLPAGFVERAMQMDINVNPQGAADQIRVLAAKMEALTDRDEERAMLADAVAAYEAGDADCLQKLEAFLRAYPASEAATNVQLLMGDVNFFHHEFGAALRCYDEVSETAFNGGKKDRYDYRRGLCLASIGEYKASRSIFRRLASKKGYEAASTFYLAYLDYATGDREAAYRGFSSVEGRMPEAAYYLAQMDYARGDYRKAQDRAKTMLRAGKERELEPEMQRIAGESAFRLGNYSEAKKYLTQYVDGGATEPNVSAVYDLGVIEYEEGDYEKAARRFASLTDLRNELSQSAYLYLGQCEVRRGDDSAAMLAFRNAAEQGFDRNVSETALYNYVVAMMRGGSLPFASSTEMLEDFLRRYPDSQYASTVRQSLASAYYNDRNYAKALESINRIPNPDGKVQTAKQKVLYRYGMQLMNAGNAAKAIPVLKEGASMTRVDKEIAAQCRLWLGDALYADGKYAEASQAYEAFLKEQPKSADRSLALYNLGYARYMEQKYKEAERRFGEALTSSPALSAALKQDARVRRADCLYYTGKFAAAAEEYTKVAEGAGTDADYAKYRRAVMYGLTGDTARKLNELTSLASTYPNSIWLPAALLEKADTYMSIGQTANAIKAYEELSLTYPSSAEARKGMLKLAIAYAESGQGAKAENSYKNVIMRWPTSEEAGLANEDLRRIYASRGELGEYSRFLQSVPNAPQISSSEMEQLAFEAAERKFADNISDTALLKAYVKDYPGGRYLAQALYDLAESAFDAGRYAEANGYLDTLLAKRPDSAQRSEAWLMKAELLENELGRPDEAAEAYRSLLSTGESAYMPDAYAGLMRTSKDPQQVLEFGRRLLESGAATSQQQEEAKCSMAEAMLQTGRTSEAMTELQQLARNPQSIYGAKASVLLAQAFTDAGEYDRAESVLKSLAESGTPHQYWLARGFIALADVYELQGKRYLAVEYLTSLRDNYPGAESDIAAMISSRLKKWK